MNTKGVLTLLATAALVVALHGCNTMKGVAKDLDAGAEAGQQVIKDATSD